MKMPPSEATFQYPPPSGVDAMPTMGLFRCPGAAWFSHPVNWGFWWNMGHARLPKVWPALPANS